MTAYSQFTHRQAWLQQSDPEIRIHYVEAKPSGTQKGVILLIHGFPESSYQFSHVMGPLSAAGYRVIAPDYRGAGYSSRPNTGYTKKVLATDLHTLLMEHVGIKDAVHVVGHDNGCLILFLPQKAHAESRIYKVGAMIAHAYAHLFPESVASLIWGECPLPGTTVYDDNKHAPGLWHFSFHSVPDLPELLVSGHEKQYLKHFYDRLAMNPAAFTEADLDFYATLYSAPGAMRAGFNVYRTFEEDKVDNRRLVEERGKLKVRTMVLSGEGSNPVLGSEEMAREVDEDVVVGKVEASGHWIAEENPQGFVEKVLGFIE
ncbi:MAG: hypothetical protein Q9184_004601 [Pyrenodesmia sp. 2 TL-2023]